VLMASPRSSSSPVKIISPVLFIGHVAPFFSRAA
jgi:hypothetical protein